MNYNDLCHLPREVSVPCFKFLSWVKKTFHTNCISDFHSDKGCFLWKKCKRMLEFGFKCSFNADFWVHRNKL